MTDSLTASPNAAAARAADHQTEQRADQPLQTAPDPARSRDGRAAQADERQGAVHRRGRAGVPDQPLPGGGGRGHHRAGRRRRGQPQQPPAAGAVRHQQHRRGQGHGGRQAAEGRQPRRQRRRAQGRRRQLQRAGPDPGLRRRHRRHRQLPHALLRQRRLRDPQEAERVRVDLPVRGAGDGVRAAPGEPAAARRARAVLPVHVPRAARPRVGAELRRRGRHRRAAGHHRHAAGQRGHQADPRRRHARRSASSPRSTRWTWSSARSSSAATPTAPSAATTRRSPGRSITSSSAACRPRPQEPRRDPGRGAARQVGQRPGPGQATPASTTAGCLWATSSTRTGRSRRAR